MSLTKVSFSMVHGAVINVLDFGAIGDGVADDTTAIQAAIDYAFAHALTQNSPTSATNQIPVYLPTGIYKVTDALSFKSWAAMRGDGPSNTTIKGFFANKSVLRSYYGENPAYGDRINGWDFRDFSIAGNNSANSIGLNMGSVGYSYIDNVHISDMAICVTALNNGYYNTWNDMNLRGGTGMYLQSDGGGNTIINPQITFTNNGIRIIQGDFNLMGGTIEGNGVLGYLHYCLNVGVTPTDGTSASLKVINTYFETYDTAVNGRIGFYGETMYQCTLIGISKRGNADRIDVAVPNNIYIQSFLGNYTPNQTAVQISFGAAIDGPARGYLKTQGGSYFVFKNSGDTGTAYVEMESAMLNGPAIPLTGKVSLGNTHTTSVGAAGGATALPATPLGYLTAYVGTDEVRIPYYSA